MNAPYDPTLAESLVWPARINEIPKAIFDREDIYQLELERFFYGPYWHPLGHVSEFPAPGSFKSTWIGERPVLVVHGEDGRIRVFYNACSHRGTLLETSFMGCRKAFECPYHRWLFDTTGALRGAPGKDDFAPGFRDADYGLTELRSEVYYGMVFATASAQGPTLPEFLEDAAEPFRLGLGGDGRLALLGYQKVVYQTNWKFYFDNDGYHAPLLHAAFKLLGWQGGQGRQAATPGGHLCFTSELKVPRQADFLQDPSLVAFRGTDPRQGSVIAGLMPITGIVKHMDVINVRYAFPRGIAQTEVHYAYYAHADDDPEMVRHRLRQASNLLGPSGLVSMEDASVFHRLQAARAAPGTFVFQKGVKDERALSYEFKQNDESGNLPRWEHYRRVMGIPRAAAA
jgi:anthranilate 1,2-dioxygenase large subunit